MNICFYTDTFFPLVGGAEMVLHHLATELVRLNQQPVVLAPRIRHLSNTIDVGYPVYRYRQPFSKRYFARQTLWKLWQLHRQQRFDILHCHAGYPQAHVGIALCRWYRLPMVVRPHGSDIVPGGRIRKHLKLEQRLRNALNATNKVIAQGEHLKNLILELGVKAERCG